MTALITREALLRPRLKHEDLDVPELGGTVRLRELTTGEVEAIRAASKGGDVDMQQGSRLLAYAIVDGDGKRILGDEDVDVLKGLPLAVTQRLLRSLNKLNGLEGAEAAKN